jgi:hypothetical protein
MRKYVRISLEMVGQAATLLLGFYLLWLNFYGDFSYGTGTIARLNKALFMGGALLLIASSFLFMVNKIRRKIIYFIVSLFVFAMIVFIVGGGFGAFDALSEGGSFSSNDMWAGYTATASNGGEWVNIGIFINLLADALNVILPIGVIVVCIAAIIYAGESDEWIKAGLEAAMAIGVLIVYAWLIAPAFNI